MDPVVASSPTVLTTSRPSPPASLTLFPQAYADNGPEQGIIPSILSKVKSTFTSSVSTPSASGDLPPQSLKPQEKGPSDTQRSPPRVIVQTEAQALAEAVKKGTHVRRKSGSAPTVSIQPLTALAEEPGPSTRPFPSPVLATTSPRHATHRPIRPALSTVTSDSSIPSIQPSILSIHSEAEASLKKLVNRNSGRWRPLGAASALVGVAAVPEVTGIMASDSASTRSGATMNFPAALQAARTHSRARFGQSSISSPRSKPLIYQAYPQPPGRRRRSSNVTIPDSPSSVSLSAMIAHNAELSQNNLSSIPGFSIQDDTRSVRSFAMPKNGTNVSRIIRRIRGEGLSKQYWMSDESCKECYDCNSTFSAWRRKHHCRICGQIFCSRCASNIITASRFGQDGAVRVCNICIKIMDQVRNDDDDDRRSITSVATSFRFPSGPDAAFLDVPAGHEGHYVRSPFAASQLFISQPNESLMAIDEGEVPSGWGGDMQADRPLTPLDIGGSQISENDDDDHIWATRPNTAAPFRRPIDQDAEAASMTEEEKTGEESQNVETPSPGDDPGQDIEVQSPIPPRINEPLRRGIPFPRTDTVSTDGGELALGDSRGLIGLRTTISTRESHGGLAALVEPDRTEGLWRARTRSFAGNADVIVGASIRHFHIMLQQALARAELSHAAQWHDALSKLLLRVSTNVLPDVRAGDSMDVRNYAKVKKVPGGRIADCEYVDGMVISKNVAHKHMPRRLVNPRVMVVTFPLDYHRLENQFMSLEPIMAQEKDYLRLLTKRVIDVRPHIVLADRSVSSIAIEHLLEANIAVARNVKLSAIQQVARCTQADVIASMDRLVLEPRLGRCSEFNVQTFDNGFIPGRRKTLMRFEGCQREYGCTLILRGGDLTTLRKVKLIAKFMSMVAYHLRSEIVMYGDQHSIPPPRPPLSDEYEAVLKLLRSGGKPQLSHLEDSAITISPSKSTGTLSVTDDIGRHHDGEEGAETTLKIATSLEPYLTTVLSASTAVRFPPPYALARMALLDRRLSSLKVAHDEEEAAQILEEETKATETGRLAVPLPDVEPKLATSVPSSETSLPSLAEVPSSTAMSAIASGPAPTRESTRDPYRVLRKPEEVHRESTLQQVKHEHQEQLRAWAWYTRRHTNPLRPEDYQSIVYLHSMGTEGAEKPCVEPRLESINFYQPGDETLGQYFERLASDAWHRCGSKTCNRLLLHHYHLLVHGERRLQIAIDEFNCPIPGFEDQILVWNYCPICSTASPVVVTHEESLRMSWGSYLEQCFCPPEVPADFACSHDAFRDHIRYFAYHNLAIRIHNEKIDLYEPVKPSVVLQVKPESKVLLKNQEYESALQKNTSFFDSVLFRLRAFDENLVEPAKQSALRVSLQTLLSKAVTDREEMVNLLNRTYKLTPLTDVLALNAVLRALQDKVVHWDQEFTDLEKSFMPSEKDLRYMTANHLKKLFANPDVFGTLEKSVVGLTVPEVDEKESRTSQDSLSTTEPPTPAFSMDSDSTDALLDPPELEIGPPSEEVTPLAGVLSPRQNPLSSLAPPSGSPSDGDSDSTISAVRIYHGEDGKDTFRRRRQRDKMVSGSMESDGKEFASRIPRPQQAPSDQQRPARPKLRRNRTEQPPSSRHRDTSKLGVISDGERSYAAYAARAPSAFGKRGLGGPSTLRPKDMTHSRKSSMQSNNSGRSTEPSPNPLPERLTRHSSTRRVQKVTNERNAEKGKGRATPEPGSANLAMPTLRRTVTKKTITGPRSSTVQRAIERYNEIARRADEAKRNAITHMRARRARPVEPTRAKVFEFNNLRDAFREDDETDSSQAGDNEQDQDAGSDDSADSNAPPLPRSNSEPSHGTQLIGIVPPPLKSPHVKTVPMSPISAALDVTPSLTSDVASVVSLSDRLHVELPSFETNAPLPSIPPTPQMSSLSMTDTADEGKAAPSLVSHMSESELSSGGERSSIMKTLTGLWAFRAGDFTPLDYPLSASEHLFADSKVIIRESEPTSIIAFTLSSKNYRDKMTNVYMAQRKLDENVEAFMPEEGTTDRSSTWDIVSIGETMDRDDTSRRDGGTHLKYDFESGTSTIFCRIFFAEQFATLRSVCQCEENFVESLSRCVQFDAAGGKSGSAFLKTKDDRFIAKEISRLEMDALTKFAPAYFDYTRKAFQSDRPTVLAKIYGFFKIGYRNAVTGRTMRMNVLIMENLFYERRFSRIYDLKGSTRNRLIQPTGRVNEVLLDENLLEIAYKHPLYLRDHSKRVLRLALYNDTLFLSNLNVMDYSLVVGVDPDKKELVVGIVDYIRTFTWDKKLESWVKDSAFLGGAGKGEPTIVTPKQYKLRFRGAMEKNYFPAVPDRWTKIGSDESQVDEEGEQAKS
ncbi:hypothetical protein TREMEDRAFT_34462 [Tremella mesenterica DSM 1558]|uniref:uncharacterized protein n=1 Tax=Tremella mesenterica (strain ATCC 24925 / CBS 8224 / DSM 1558 / NBRC 9311 / NRRL Y-6157 / RJB 2259-6 / UBC 559-6) TaxID=578456 RepID=UPI00032CF2F9|nr:uncharacterized protein TREMEDRAFT_34462 [Tremella mesenterica DSM 1558]EIW66777.1 hypothetical protein TREMEDRAFT_34462 [Tremella mesenterica DSM 1558]